MVHLRIKAMGMYHSLQQLSSQRHHTGYSLNGTATRNCHEDASWSDSAPFCQIKGSETFHFSSLDL